MVPLFQPDAPSTLPVILRLLKLVPLFKTLLLDVFLLWLPQRLCVFKVSVLLRLHKFFYRRVSSAIKREKSCKEWTHKELKEWEQEKSKKKKEKKRQQCASEERVKSVYWHEKHMVTLREGGNEKETEGKRRTKRQSWENEFFFLYFCFGQASLWSYFMTVFRPDTQTSSVFIWKIHLWNIQQSKRTVEKSHTSHICFCLK